MENNYIKLKEGINQSQNISFPFETFFFQEKKKKKNLHFSPFFFLSLSIDFQL